MRKGSPVAYNAETGLAEPAQKAYTGEPNERTTLYRIRRPQENRQLLREGERRNNSRGRKDASEARNSGSAQETEIYVR